MANLSTNVLDIPPGAKRKAFQPLENNPEIMSNLAYHLGLSNALIFQDVYSIDDCNLLAMIPRPCYGLLLVFPINEAYEAYRIEEDKSLEDYNESGEDEEVVWFKQTIGTGCGMIAVLHCLVNGAARAFINPRSDLDCLFQQILPLKPIERANALCDSDALEAANELVASCGDSEIIPANTPMDLHFVCFTKSREHNLWELDGRRKGPINRGLLEENDDALSERALELGVRAFLDREKGKGVNDLRFSLIALVPNTSQS